METEFSFRIATVCEEMQIPLPTIGFWTSFEMCKVCHKKGTHFGGFKEFVWSVCDDPRCVELVEMWITYLRDYAASHGEPSADHRDLVRAKLEPVLLQHAQEELADLAQRVQGCLTLYPAILRKLTNVKLRDQIMESTAVQCDLRQVLVDLANADHQISTWDRRE